VQQHYISIFFLPCIVYTNNFKQTTFQKDVASLQKDNSSICDFPYVSRINYKQGTGRLPSRQLPKATDI